MPSRRTVLKSGLAAGVGLAVGGVASAAPLKGNIKHSLVWWCFNSVGDKWDIATMCQHAKDTGCVSIELVEPTHWKAMAKAGLTCAISGNGAKKTGFMYGLNNPKTAPEVVEATTKRIAECQEAKVPSVIGFSGYKWVDPTNPKSGEISRDDGAKEMVKNLKTLAIEAEKAGVTVCVEHLNTRDGSHPMKGHPGYMADDLDWLVGVIKQVGSPKVKILFDLYHVQIMHGDLIRRIEDNKEYIGHIHTAGNPGRGELDDSQEIHFAGCMKKLVQIGYTGYVGHEFIPTRNALEGVKQAIAVCDV
ncbi:MAG: TIM barrel protein [Fimbriiglobus sp.]